MPRFFVEDVDGDTLEVGRVPRGAYVTTVQGGGQSSSVVLTDDRLKDLIEALSELRRG